MTRNEIWDSYTELHVSLEELRAIIAKPLPLKLVDIELWKLEFNTLELELAIVRKNTLQLLTTV